MSQPEMTFTLRPPPYKYLHLSVSHPTSRSPGSGPQLDAITLATFVTAALRSFLGLSGTATPVDILHVDDVAGEAWVRVPREDGTKVRAALAQWAGRNGERVNVKGMSSWLGGLGSGMAGEGVKLWTLDA